MNAIKAAAHKGFTGIQIFCPACQNILDHRKSVSIDIMNKSTNDILWTKVICLDCFNNTVEQNLSKLANDKFAEAYNGKTRKTIIYGKD